ncbi:hypothetical protein KY318_00175, partial [Candidatus Woesearchaeota archaeon]|nr:hypothetical protein [Candidatus Woesearchaeota archaeon]
MAKRGALAQVSIFMVIALIILIGIGVLIFLKTRGMLEMGGSEIPKEFLPVSKYVDSCLRRVGLDAIKLVGVQGGYARVPEEIANNPEAYLPLIGNLKIPFWYYNNKNHVPSKRDIEQSIAEYIATEIPNCLGGFAPLNHTFIIKPSGSPRVNVFIKEEEVELSLDYPLEVATHSSSAEIRKFKQSVDVRLGRILRLAHEIMNAENREAWLEKRTIDLMATMPDRVIPFTNLAFSCLPLEWKTSDVESELKQTLKYNIPRVRVKKTKHLPFEKPLEYYEGLGKGMGGEIPGDMAEYAMLLWDPLSEEFNDLRVGFVYMPEWGMEFKVSPSSSGLMKSYPVQGRSFKGINLVGTCIQFYHFTYDLTYPVRVTIFDSASLGNNGYSFNFAFPVIVYHNT